MVYDSRGEDITSECTVSYKHAPHGGETFIVETHRDIVHGSGERTVWEDGREKTTDGENPLGETGETEIVVEYRVQIQDPSLAGHTVDNTALAATDEPNTATTDDAVVNVKGAKLVVEKTSDKATYEAGETARYRLVVSQAREDAVARNVVVKDVMDEEGIGQIAKGSLVVTGPKGEPIDAEPAYRYDEAGRIVGFEVATGADLADEEELTLTYDVLMEQAGTALGNKVQASADGAIDGTDAHEVDIVKVVPDDPSDKPDPEADPPKDDDPEPPAEDDPGADNDGPNDPAPDDPGEDDPTSDPPSPSEDGPAEEADDPEAAIPSSPLDKTGDPILAWIESNGAFAAIAAACAIAGAFILWRARRRPGYRRKTR